jgi:hypothetical protein
LLRSRSSGIGIVIAITAIRYIWSDILSVRQDSKIDDGPGLGTEWFTHPVRGVVFRFRITWRNCNGGDIVYSICKYSNVNSKDGGDGLSCKASSC